VGDSDEKHYGFTSQAQHPGQRSAGTSTQGRIGYGVWTTKVVRLERGGSMRGKDCLVEFVSGGSM
jgi:hypothetical protein